MGKRAIITLSIGEHYQKIAQITHPTLKRYADKIGADFVVISERKISQTTPHWEKFQILDFLNKYDRILYLDTDILIRKNCPDLFDIVPEDELGIYNEAPFVPSRDYAIARIAEQYEVNDFKWDGKYYNTGVMVISKCHRSLFRKPEKEIFNFYEQSFINMQIQRQKPKIHELDYKFNRMTCVDKVIGRNRFESYVIHYAGVNFASNGFGIVLSDFRHIETLPDDYVAPKHIWLVVQGGMGDQVQAEPTIRFALNSVWKGADIRVSTHFPEFFTHLPIVCKRHEEKIWDIDTEPFTRNTLPGPETVQWRIVSNLMCHTVDYISMAVLCRTLPDIDKSYQIPVNEDAVRRVREFMGINDVSDCVLVHCGRHWQSKSFPAPWWQEVLDGIVNLGLIPVLIGKDDSTRGVVKVDGRGKSIDLTNLLTLEEFIAIVSLVPILISNDSSPIHIAGAFDNWIVLIPTCKHPDHILPYRHGSKTYKSVALYKKLALDDMMTSVAEMMGSTADKIPGEWSNYLTEASVVVQKIKEIANDLSNKPDTIG
jgi:glycosyl transferase family 8/glycosyl transferase family 9 (putative heptosyltransferase)